MDPASVVLSCSTPARLLKRVTDARLVSGPLTETWGRCPHCATRVVGGYDEFPDVKLFGHPICGHRACSSCWKARNDNEVRPVALSGHHNGVGATTAALHHAQYHGTPPLSSLADFGYHSPIRMLYWGAQTSQDVFDEHEQPWPREVRLLLQVDVATSQAAARQPRR